MSGQLRVLDSYEGYREYVQQNFPPEQAKAILNEFQTVCCRYLLLAWGVSRNDPTRKMSGAEVQAAIEAMASLSISRLEHAESDIARAFDLLKASPSSRRTYGARLEQFLRWCKVQAWWPDQRRRLLETQCCPPRQVTGRRHYKDLRLTRRSGQYVSYALQEDQIPLALRLEFLQLKRFWCDPYYPGRLFEPIEPSTFLCYMKEVRLILGFLVNHMQPPVPLEELTLASIVPVVDEEHLDTLSHRQQKQYWREVIQKFDAQIQAYWMFFQSLNQSSSPRTVANKLTVIQRVAHFLYRHQVSRKSDYQMIPFFAALKDSLGQATRQVTKATHAQTYVADREAKFPDYVEGETALTTLRKQVVEPLRLQTRPRRHSQGVRDPFVIAIALYTYLKWAFLTERPARRQKEYRDCRIALNCPSQRPESVPADGFYFPLPAPENRVLGKNGGFGDNYLYKTYVYQGRSYPDGVWVLECNAYKTRGRYGQYSIAYPNVQFADGSFFYDYIENYLCGQWFAEGYKHCQVFDWWASSHSGRKGRWVTKGRGEFDPKDFGEFDPSYGAVVYRWGYIFPVPSTGELGDGTSFGGSFTRTSYHLLNKRITPHVIRNMWATWGIQVNSTDAELRSLAFAMGHSVKTLYEIYSRCTPEEKVRPICEAIDRHFLQSLDES